MDAALLVVLALVGGYIFASRWIVTKLVVDREDGHRLYFRAAFYGVFLFFCAILIRYSLLWHWSYFETIERTLFNFFVPSLKEPHDHAQESAALVALYALILGSFLWIPFQWLPLRVKHFLYDRAIRNNEFESLIASAARRFIPISVTMESNKVYVGFLKETPDPRHQREFLTLLPLMSGYREVVTGKVRFTTFYDTIYDNLHKISATLTPDDFTFVLPTDKINSLNMFDVAVYEEFQNLATKKSLDSTRRARKKKK